MRRILATLTALISACCAAGPNATPRTAPEFTHISAAEWINSVPLTVAGLRGRVLLIEFWTFGCVNCQRALPWLIAAHEKYAQAGLVIISVHTPEFALERDLGNVRAAVQKEGIHYAVMVDNDQSYWNAFANRYWPAFYLIGRDGRVVATAIGELHRGTARGEEFESKIKELLGSN